MFMFLTILTLSLISQINCFPNGAPLQVCGTMHPGHRTIEPEPEILSTYKIYQSSNTFNPGQEIKVTIKSKDGVPFKGFMVKALNPKNNETIGTFEAGSGLKNLEDCSAVTHSDPNGKKTASLYWKAPTDRAGQVLFRATVVQKYDKYFEAVLSHKDKELTG